MRSAICSGLLATGIESWQGRSWPRTRVTLVLYGIVGVVLILRYNVLAYVFTILLQMGSGFRSVDLSLSLFPYFMIPTGLANLFGLMPLAVNFPEPVTSLTILAGLAALATALAWAAREAAGVMARIFALAAVASALALLPARLLPSGPVADRPAADESPLVDGAILRVDG